MKGVGHRVAITGLGVVAPCGIGKEAYWSGLMGRGITNTRSLEIADWDPQPYFDSPKDARRADRVEQLALAAAAEAFAQTGSLNVDQSRFGTIFATGILLGSVQLSKIAFAIPLASVAILAPLKSCDPVLLKYIPLTAFIWPEI